MERLIFLASLLLLVAERLIELERAKRNESRLRSIGAKEFGGGHYAFFVLLHSFFFAFMLGEFFFLRQSELPFPWAAALLLFLFAQMLRVWVFRTMRDRWTTRILVVAGEKFISGGPYRYFRHPNYVAVSLEILSFPLTFGLWRSALVCSLLNAVLILGVRIPAENQALRWAGEE